MMAFSICVGWLGLQSDLARVFGAEIFEWSQPSSLRPIGGPQINFTYGSITTESHTHAHRPTVHSTYSLYWFQYIMYTKLRPVDAYCTTHNYAQIRPAACAETGAYVQTCQTLQLSPLISLFWSLSAGA